MQNKPLSCAPSALLVCAFVLGFSAPVVAQPPEKISGTAIVLDSGHIQINGQKIALWGLSPLAGDQQCWQNGAPWCCGEEATQALRHFVDGKIVECTLQQRAVDGAPAVGQCSKISKSGQVRDLSKFMIERGWAMERGTASGGTYFSSEQEAQNEKRGIWSGRFQTAEDWREGIQRFVGEEEDPAPDKSEE